MAARGLGKGLDSLIPNTIGEAKEKKESKEKVENKTSSGIILTTESKSMPSVATVVAIGKDCKAEIKENDQVVYKEYSGTNIKIDEVEYIIISEKDILGYLA